MHAYYLIVTKVIVSANLTRGLVAYL
jgi:hypothetical protein